MVQTKTVNINREIKATKILLINENGQNLGIVSINEALSNAFGAGLDLIEVGNKDGIAVCKIIDYGKWKYEQEKRKKKNSSFKQQTKEIKFRPTTCDNDLVYRAKHVDEFLKEGHKVRLVVKFKGREQEHMLTTGKSLLEKFLNKISINFCICNNATVEGNSITMTLSNEGK